MVNVNNIFGATLLTELKLRIYIGPVARMSIPTIVVIRMHHDSLIAWNLKMIS